MKIGIFGLGYVGTVNAVCFSDLGHIVFCTDVKQEKVELFKNGKCPVKEPLVEELLIAGLKNNSIQFRNSISEILEEIDVAIICVGTPSAEDGKVNLSYAKNVTMDIAMAYHPKMPLKYLVYRSTVPPGTTANLYDIFSEKVGINEVCPVFMPEFLREGTAVDDFHHAPRVVLGTDSKKDLSDLSNLVSDKGRLLLFITDMCTAEYIKYVDNCFHALKVTFANEVYRLGKQYDIDIKKANEIFLADTVLNISKTYLRPGLPFGGSCLPKDLREIEALVSENHLELPLMSSMLKSNRIQKQEMLKMVQGLKKTKIGIVGITFKNDTDDLRESPLLELTMNLMKDSGTEISVWDEDIDENNLRRTYPQLYILLTNFENLIQKSELIIVSKRFMEKVSKASSEGQTIINFANLNEFNSKAKIVNWF